MKPRHLARLLERIANQLDADDIAAEHTHRATRQPQRQARTPSWTLREVKVVALPTPSP